MEQSVSRVPVKQENSLFFNKLKIISKSLNEKPSIMNLLSSEKIRPLDISQIRVLDMPLSSLAFHSHLKLYLRSLNIDDGETPRSIRVGCAVTMAVTVCGNEQDIMNHVVWFGRDSFLRHSRLEKITDRSSVSNMFKSV